MDRPPSWPARARAWRAWVAALALVCLAGCEDPNSVFEGHWVSNVEYSGTYFNGRPELALGHYGQEVAGVVYFKTGQVGTGHVAGCPCGFVGRSSLDLDARRVVFNTVCETPGDEPAEPLDWILEIVDDDGVRVLDGTVQLTSTGEQVEQVTLQLTTTTVSDSLKRCPPESN